MNICRLIDNGRIHIVVNEKYLGSFRIYENSFVKKITKILNLSITVLIDDETCTVKKKEYRKHLQRFNLQNTSSSSYAKAIRNSDRIDLITEKLWPHLGVKTQQVMINRFFQAICRDQHTLAIQLVRLGTPMVPFYYCKKLSDQVFLDIDLLLQRAKQNHSCNAIEDENQVQYKCKSYTPLAYVVYKTPDYILSLKERNDLIKLLYQEYKHDAIEEWITITSVKVSSEDPDEENDQKTEEKFEPIKTTYEVIHSLQYNFRQVFDGRNFYVEMESEDSSESD